MDSLADEVLCIVHAFPDDGRKDEVRDLAAKVRAVEAERDRLAAQLAQDAPLAAAARDFERAASELSAAMKVRDGDLTTVRAPKVKARLTAENALLDLARAQKGGG